MQTTLYTQERLLDGKRDFFNWFTEYDRRRGTNFAKTFPKMITFMEQCSELV